MTSPLMQVRTIAAPVRQLVLDAIRDAIVAGRFRPGQRLVEKDLCEMLGVSRPSVREALRHLESEGLIQTIPNRGPVVATLTREEVVAVYEVRAALESLAARLCSERATDAQITELSATFNELVAATRGEEVPSSIAAKDRFYDQLFTSGGNTMIPTILRGINARITFLRRLSMSTPQRLTAMIDEIEDIVVAIRNRDGDAAHAATLRHIASAAEVALAVLDREAAE